MARALYRQRCALQTGAGKSDTILIDQRCAHSAAHEYRASAMITAAETAAAPVVAGFGALLVAAVGVDPQALLWASVGAVVGMSLAPPAGRARAILLYVAVVLSGALLARWAAAEMFADSAVARNGLAWILGAFFHPLFAAVTAGIPSVVARCIDRIGGPRP